MRRNSTAKPRQKSNLIRSVEPTKIAKQDSMQIEAYAYYEQNDIFIST
jgi:hypothetical protein